MEEAGRLSCVMETYARNVAETSSCPYTTIPKADGIQKVTDNVIQHLNRYQSFLNNMVERIDHLLKRSIDQARYFTNHQMLEEEETSTDMTTRSNTTTSDLHWPRGSPMCQLVVQHPLLESATGSTCGQEIRCCSRLSDHD
ncbi:unnamed protein product [Dicrocoelium dendriticum]|nr:unnamed protein product [Dicrocoelium dendriticum]